jgi:HAD superfamily hydrolase (TIGR01549 family)
VPVTFDLFGTLVTAHRPTEPWAAVANELAARDVAIPSDWEAAYRSSHHDDEPLRERSLVAHTRAALASRGVETATAVVHEALLEAFDGPIERREGAVPALEAAAEGGPVGILSNCSLPGLVKATLERASLPIEFDAVTTSVGCGWRKPHDRAFEAAAEALGVPIEDLVHVGDDPRADGGGRTAGVHVVLTGETPLQEFSAWMEDRT